MQYLGHPYTKTLFLVYLKFWSNKTPCILCANIKLVIENSLPNSGMKGFAQVLLAMYALSEVKGEIEWPVILAVYIFGIQPHILKN